MHPVKLDTAFGYKQYQILALQEVKHKGNQSLLSFKERCKQDYELISHYLNFFLEDEEIAKKHKFDDEDVIGWKTYNELSEMIDCLHYFGWKTTQIGKNEKL